MTDTVIGAAETMLRTVLESTEDDDARFKLRTVLQLLVVAEDEHERLAETLNEADLDEELSDRLRGLGYID